MFYLLKNCDRITRIIENPKTGNVLCKGYRNDFDIQCLMFPSLFSSFYFVEHKLFGTVSKISRTFHRLLQEQLVIGILVEI
jgi:hypothetical protein